jgi:hypothetical protein
MTAMGAIQPFSALMRNVGNHPTRSFSGDLANGRNRLFAVALPRGGDKPPTTLHALPGWQYVGLKIGPFSLAFGILGDELRFSVLRND